MFLKGIQAPAFEVEMSLRGSDVHCESEVLDLKDPEYRFFSNPGATSFDKLHSFPLILDNLS